MKTFKEISQTSRTNYNVSRLLSSGLTNTKTAKNNEISFILYIAPFNINFKGVNLCPKASKGCAASCLFTSGRGRFENVYKSRVNKANYFVGDKVNFIKHLAIELQNKIKYHAKKGNKLYIRLNGTSDLDFVYMLKKYANFNISDHANVFFYDYTKIKGKATKYVNSQNYKVLFSRSENNENECISVLNKGGSIAVVFRNKLPKTYLGFEVVDGEKSDIQMFKYKNVVFGLLAKGDAKKDQSGFVVD